MRTLKMTKTSFRHYNLEKKQKKKNNNNKKHTKKQQKQQKTADQIKSEFCQCRTDTLMFKY